MRVLVTGAGGFSGAEVTSRLLLQGYRVWAWAGRASTGRLSHNTLAHPSLTVLTGDLADEARPLPAEIDAVVHTAATSPAPGVGVATMVRDNVVATHRLAAYARAVRARSVIYFSSLSIHGAIRTDVVDDATPVIDPDPYGQTKRLGEELFAEQADAVRGFAIRLPGVIGRGAVRNWLTDVLARARQGREITIYNPDAPFNNAAHIRNVADFVVGLLENEGWQGFHAAPIGAGGRTTVEATVRQIVAETGGTSSVLIGAGRKTSFTISNDAAQTFGYCPDDIAAMVSRFVHENHEQPFA